MRCLVINLDRSRDRLAHVASEFGRIGVPLERVSAIDCPDCCSVAKSPLSAAEVCCFLSHRSCREIVANGADQYGAVFEDDVVFGAGAGSLLASDRWVPRDADVIKLETHFAKVRVGRKEVALDDGFSLARLYGLHAGAAGYVLSRSAAQRLLRRTMHLRGEVDFVLFHPGFMTCSLNRIYQIMPALCAQHHFVSGRERFPSLVRRPGRRPKEFLDRIVGEAVRTFAYLRNQSLTGTKKIEAVAFSDSEVDDKPVHGAFVYGQPEHGHLYEAAGIPIARKNSSTAR